MFRRSECFSCVAEHFTASFSEPSKNSFDRLCAHISIVPRDDNNNDNDVWGLKTHLPLATPIRSASGRTEAAGMALWQATIFMRAHYDVTLRRNNKELAAAPYNAAEEIK